MNIDWAVYALILSMAVIVYTTRIAGSEVMSFFKMTPRLEAILKSMATSVLVAIVASKCAQGDTRMLISVGVAILTMVIIRNSLVSMTLGITTAAAMTFFTN